MLWELITDTSERCRCEADHDAAGELEESPRFRRGQIVGH